MAAVEGRRLERGVRQPCAALTRDGRNCSGLTRIAKTCRVSMTGRQVRLERSQRERARGERRSRRLELDAELPYRDRRPKRLSFRCDRSAVAAALNSGPWVLIAAALPNLWQPFRDLTLSASTLPKCAAAKPPRGCSVHAEGADPAGRPAA